MLRTKFLLKILNNYFEVVILAALISIFTGKGYIISIFFPLLIFILSWRCGLGRRNLIDIVFILIIVSMLYSWLSNSYANQAILIFRTIMAEGAYMSAYFIGKRYGSFCIDEIFKNAFIPLSICCIIGIYLFFFPTSWYLDQLYKSDFYTGGLLSMESLRLRSIFSSPYVMAYMCGLSSIYIIFRTFRDNEKNMKMYILLVLFILTMIFCMMRAPLSCVMIAFIVALGYNCLFKGNVKTMLKTAVIGGVAFIIVSIVLQRVGTDTSTFMTEKFITATSGRNELMEERINMWDYKYKIWGDGAGRHSMIADDINPGTSIRDSEYVKILVEQGYLGLILYSLFLLLCIIKCIYHFRKLSVELCFMAFFIITMIGANSLSTSDKHCFLFWLIAGRIASYKSSFKTDCKWKSLKYQ